MSESCFTSEVYALYAIGSLDGDELGECSRHIRQGCEVCRTELAQARSLWTSFALAAPVAEPSSGLKQKILTAARHSSVLAMPPRSARRFEWWQQAAAAAAILVIGAVVGWNM